MAIKEDAGKVLLFIYQSYIKDESINAEGLLQNTKWDGSRIDRAIQHLKNIDAIDIKFILGDVDGLRNFLFEKVTPNGTGMIEDKRKFKQSFGFGVNISSNPSLNINWSVSEK